MSISKKIMRLVALVVVVMSITVSCKKDDLHENSICVTRTATHLTIENNTDKVFYIVSFGQNILPLIDWAPTCSDNIVQPNSSINQEFSLIAGYSDNDKLVAYWWECAGREPQTMHSVILDMNQTVCQ